jgi:hypothetical protein
MPMDASHSSIWEASDCTRDFLGVLLKEIFFQTVGSSLHLECGRHRFAVERYHGDFGTSCADDSRLVFRRQWIGSRRCKSLGTMVAVGIPTDQIGFAIQ